MHGLATGQSKGTVELAGRGGNPDLFLRHGSAELWASDYDTIVVVDPVAWTVTRSARYQNAQAPTQLFIGDYAFDPDERICVVARPFSGDIVMVDPATLRVRGKAGVGGQPLEVAVIDHDQVVARDWKTGDLLQGRLARRWLPG